MEEKEKMLSNQKKEIKIRLDLDYKISKVVTKIYQVQ